MVRFYIFEICTTIWSNYINICKYNLYRYEINLTTFCPLATILLLKSVNTVHGNLLKMNIHNAESVKNSQNHS